MTIPPSPLNESTRISDRLGATSWTNVLGKGVAMRAMSPPVAETWLKRYRSPNRQKQLASSQASAPLQQQITELNKQVADLTSLSGDQQEQIKRLQDQIQADVVAASQAKADAHKQGLELGAGIGVGSMVLFAGLIFTVTKLTGGVKKPLARSVSAS